MKKRENGLDLFRVIGAYLVVNTHVMSNYTAGMIQRLESGAVIPTTTAFFYYIIHAIAYWVVPCFLMISGAFSIASQGTKDYAKVYSKMWKKMVIPTLVFTAIYAVLRPVVYTILGVIPKESLGAYILKKQLPSTLCGVPSEHMWYMYVLIVLTLMSPYIVMMRETLGEKKFVMASIILLIWGMIDNQFFDYKAKWDLGLAINLLGIYMMGYVIHERAKNVKNNAKALLLILFGVIFGVILGLLNYYYMVNLPSENGAVFAKVLANQAPHNIWVVLSAMCMLAGFTMLDININVGYLSELTYWVYLVHVMVIMLVLIVDQKVVHFFEKNKGSILVMFINAILVYILSFLVSHLIVLCQKKRKAKA